MRVSIVTLSYNQRAFLQEAMDSVLNQDHSDVEYILVDPGSTDGSRELIEKCRGHISHLVLEPDKGAADGLNKGFALATGEVFGFLNADDFLLPGALRQVEEFFRAHPNCDVVMGNGYVVDAQGRHLRHLKARNFSVQTYLYGGTRWLQQSTFFRREAFRQSPGFNVQNRTCWDGELFVSIAQMGAVVGYIDADLGAFRLHSASISGSRRLEGPYREDCRRIFRQIRGREWNSSDELLSIFHRGKALVFRTALQFRATPEKKVSA
jgi:glycosyltransferase involved in cell wall biosynthesis